MTTTSKIGSQTAENVTLVGGTINGVAIGGTTPAALACTSFSPSAPNTQTGGTYTVVATDYTIIANASGTMTVTLPTPATSTGRILIIKTIASQAVNSASSNVVPLTGGAAGTAIVTNTAGKYAYLQCDGTNWNVMMSN